MKYEGKQIKCNECEQCFSTSSDLIKHMNELHSKTESSVEMCNCFRTQVETESISHNNKNLFNSEMTEAKLFECQKCEIILKSSSDLSKHMIESHLSHGPVVNECEKPQIKFETRSEFDFKTHGNDVFDCDVCYFDIITVNNIFIKYEEKVHKHEFNHKSQTFSKYSMCL